MMTVVPAANRLFLARELTWILAVKAVLLFLLWWYFFSPEHRHDVDDKQVADQLISDRKAVQFQAGKMNEVGREKHDF